MEQGECGKYTSLKAKQTGGIEMSAIFKGRNYFFPFFS